MKKPDASSVGVVVGRFQVENLHPGHRHVILQAQKHHKDVLVAIGCRTGVPTNRDPLDYELRELMITSSFGGVTVAPIFDHPQSNRAWCNALDALIEKMFPGRDAVLYGSRDSFVHTYVGKYPTYFVEKVGDVSGTTLRHEVAQAPRADASFRAGAIYTTLRRYPIAYPTVDVAFYRRNEVLLGGRDIDGGKLRFMGGFVDPSDVSIEAAGRREGNEEVKGLRFGRLHYIGSRKINDYRYRGSGDGIVTTFFGSKFLGGKPYASPSEDIDWVEWVQISELRAKLTRIHRPLGTLFIKWWKSL